MMSLKIAWVLVYGLAFKPAAFRIEWMLRMCHILGADLADVFVCVLKMHWRASLLKLAVASGVLEINS